MPSTCLSAEGVRVDRLDRVDLAAVAWPGPSLQWLEANGYDIEDLILRSQRKGRKEMSERKGRSWSSSGLTPSRNRSLPNPY